MPIKLSLPRVEPTADPRVETRAVFVEERIESLAYANPPALLDQTLEALERLNRQPLKPSLRLELLDLHIRPYAFALDFRRTQEPAQSAPALSRQRAVSRRLRLCAVAMALGYKQALADLESRRSRFGGARELRLGLQRSLLFSSLALLHCYDEYRPTLPRLWLEAIALYKVAARDGMHGDPVPAPADAPTFAQSIDDCFKRLCLTSLVDPYHLAYGELWSVHHAFGEYAPKARVLPVQETKRPAGLFVIDPALDARPSPLAQAKEPPGQRCRLLDANPVLEALRARHRGAGAGEPLPSHVLAAMVRALGLPPKRHTPRESSDGRVRLACGLGTVHHFLGGAGARPAPAGEGADIVVRDSVGLADGHRASYRHESWDLVNEGPGGIGVLRRERPGIPIGVGELVGMQFPLRGDGERDWSPGVVRWLTMGGEEECRAGVQSLGEQAMPAMVYSETVTETITRIPRPALVLPELSESADSTLLAPRGMFSPGSRLRVTAGDRSWLIEAVALAESTATFDRFRYRILEG